MVLGRSPTESPVTHHQTFLHLSLRVQGLPAVYPDRWSTLRQLGVGHGRRQLRALDECSDSGPPPMGLTKSGGRTRVEVDSRLDVGEMHAWGQSRLAAVVLFQGGVRTGLPWDRCLPKAEFAAQRFAVVSMAFGRRPNHLFAAARRDAAIGASQRFVWSTAKVSHDVGNPALPVLRRRIPDSAHMDAA